MNKTRRKMKNNGIMVYFYFLFFLASAAGMYYISNSMINTVILAIMILIIAVAFVLGLFRLNKQTIAIKNATKSIYSCNENGTIETLLAPTDPPVLFNKSYLSAYYVSFQKELARLGGAQNGVNCDINDYINEDTVEEPCHTGFITLVPGIMTGLGILGTFVGLTLGLKEFDASNAETMAASIPPLMEGIKLAFYTSIYGVVFSLGFNLVSNFQLKCVEEAVSEFLSAFYENVVPKPSNDIVKSLVVSQREELQEIKTLAETVGIKMADSFREVTMPTFEKINTTMADIADKMILHQNENLEAVTNEFIKSLNASVDNQFDNLSKTIHDTCQWQRDMMMDMQGVLDEIRNSAENVSKVNRSLESILSGTDSLLNKMDAYVKSASGACDNIEGQKILFAEAAERQQKAIESISQTGTVLVERFTEIKQSFEDVSEKTKATLAASTETYNKFSEFVKSNTDALVAVSNETATNLANVVQTNTVALVEASEKATNSMNTAMNRAADAIVSASGTFNGNVQAGIKETFGLFDSNLSEITLRLSGTIAEVNELTENIPKTLIAYSEELNSEFKKYLANVTENQKNIEKILKEASSRGN